MGNYIVMHTLYNTEAKKFISYTKTGENKRRLHTPMNNT